MASWPTFNPNDYSASPESARRNRAVQDLYEPGSTFKLVTASAAIEEGVIKPHDIIDVSAGMIRFGSRVIDDMHRNGQLSFADVIVKSSNVGAIKVGLKLGAERMGLYIRRFGFGRPSSPDFPGESPGIVWEASKLNDSALASVSMGYQVGVTPLQMAAAASVIANGGTLYEPHVVRAVVKGAQRTIVRPKVVRRAILPETAVTLTDIMEQVVLDGTAKGARLVQLRRGRQDRHRRQARQRPLLAVSAERVVRRLRAVAQSRAHGDRDGGFAARGRRHRRRHCRADLQADRRREPAPPWRDADDQSGAAGDRRATDSTSPVTPIVVAGRRVRWPRDRPGTGLPDLTGMSAREALRELARLGLSARMQGAGVVVQQDPPAGAPLEPGAHLHPRPQPSSPIATQRSHWRTTVILGDVVDALRDLTVHAPSAGGAGNSRSDRGHRLRLPARHSRSRCSSRSRGSRPTAARSSSRRCRVARRRSCLNRRRPARSTFRGSPFVMRGSRSRCWPIVSSIIRAGACRSSASPAPTARPRRRTCCARSSTPPACRAGMLGTVAYRIAGEDREASRTTPEAPDVQQLLNEMLEQGSRSAVMEVSSHALVVEARGRHARSPPACSPT